MLGFTLRHLFLSEKGKYIKMRFDREITVPGDRVPFVLMSVTLGEGLCRLLCVLHSNRSGPTGERKKEKKRKALVPYSMVKGTINVLL